MPMYRFRLADGRNGADQGEFTLECANDAEARREARDTINHLVVMVDEVETFTFDTLAPEWRAERAYREVATEI